MKTLTIMKQKETVTAKQQEVQKLISFGDEQMKSILLQLSSIKKGFRTGQVQPKEAIRKCRILLELAVSIENTARMLTDEAPEEPVREYTFFDFEEYVDFAATLEFLDL